jgi:hypothetical protein
MFRFFKKIFHIKSASAPLRLPPETCGSPSDQSTGQSQATADPFLLAICASDDPENIKRLATEAACNLAPLELKDLYNRIEHTGLQVPVDVFRRSAPLWGELNRRDIKLPDFDNIRISTHARFYISKDSSRKKALLIIFTGLTGMAGINYCRLLNRIPAGMDVLFVRRHKNFDYRFGVPGLGNGFLDSCKRMESLLSIKKYQGVGCLGTSLGGLWALRAAMVLRANIGVSMSGSFSRCVRDVSPYDQDIEDDPLLSYQRNQSARLYCFYGAGAMEDAKDAERFRSMVPSVSLVPVEGFSGHHVMWHLNAKRQLKSFFSTLHKGVLDSSAELW